MKEKLKEIEKIINEYKEMAFKADEEKMKAEYRISEIISKIGIEKFMAITGTKKFQAMLYLNRSRRIPEKKLFRIISQLEEAK